MLSDPNGMYECQRPGHDYMLSHAGKACYTAYYGKAFASLKQEKRILAVENFWNASLCNNRCDTTYYLLEELKRTENWKESAEAAEKRRLHLDWNSDGNESSLDLRKRSRDDHGAREERSLDCPWIHDC